MTASSQSGYTFIELLIVSGIIVIILGISFGGLTTVLINRGKAKSRLKLKEQGEFVVQSLERLATNALDIEDSDPNQCTLDMNQITIIDVDQEATMVECNNGTDELRIGSEAVIDSASNYDLTNCIISCYNNNRRYQNFSVDFSFTLQDMASSEIMSFSTKATLRN